MVVGYVGVAIFATWPLARHPLGGFYGFGNDNWGGIWIYDWIHRSTFGPGDPAFSPELQAPFGYSLPRQGIQPLDRAFAILFGGPGHGLLAYNLQIFLGFALAGCTMYVLAAYVTRNRAAAGIAGFVYTFSPFHLALAMQYPALASIQWIPLFLLAFLVLLRTPSLRAAVLTGGAFALVAVTTYYHAWFIGWTTLVVLGLLATREAVRRRRELRSLGRPVYLALSRAFVAGAVATALVAPLVVGSARGARSNNAELARPLGDAVRYSGRPWMLVVPPLDNPLVGRDVRRWVELHLYDNPVYEQSTYLGYTVLVLVALALWRRRSVRLPLAGLERFARPTLVAVAVVGLLITLGPHIPLDRDYWRLHDRPWETRHLPSLGRVMFELGPAFRFFSRAFVVVSAAVAVLAAIGFARLDRRLTRRAGAALAGVLVVVVGIEFTNAPPHVWYSAETPAWVEAVARLPAGSSVVDYPTAAVNSPRSLYYIFWQREHGHPTVNPPQSPRAVAFTEKVADPDDPAAGEALRKAGIDYALVHTRLPPPATTPYQAALPPDALPPSAGSANPWFRRVARTPDAVVYRILPAPERTP